MPALRDAGQVLDRVERTRLLDRAIKEKELAILRKIANAIDEILPVALLRNYHLISRSVKRGVQAESGRLHLDQPLFAVGLERENVVSQAVALILGDMVDPVSELARTGSPKASVLERHDEFFAASPEIAICCFDGDVVGASRYSRGAQTFAHKFGFLAGFRWWNEHSEDPFG